MAAVIPPTTPAAANVSKTYPGVAQVTDPIIQQALRVLHDLLSMFTAKATPTRGTLEPDQKPVLTPLQTGYLFWASDFDRVFRWTGTTWEDAPGMPTRGQVGFFRMSPGIGWSQCNGNQTQTTGPGGQLFALTTPTIDSINGLLAWIRL